MSEISLNNQLFILFIGIVTNKNFFPIRLSQVIVTGGDTLYSGQPTFWCFDHLNFNNVLTIKQ